MTDAEKRRERLLSEVGYRVHQLRVLLSGTCEEFPDDRSQVAVIANRYLRQAGFALQLVPVEGDGSGRCSSVRVLEKVPHTPVPQDFRCDKCEGHDGDHLNVSAYPGKVAVRWASKV